MKEKEQNYYFTFGLGHPVHRHHYVKLYGTFDSTRQKMFDAFGEKWAFQYDEEHWEEIKAQGFVSNHTQLEWED